MGPADSRSTDSSALERALRGLTLLTTGLGKLLGLGIGVNEILIRPSLRESALAYGALIFAGAEAVERALVRTLKTVFSPEDEK